MSAHLVPSPLRRLLLRQVLAGLVAGTAALGHTTPARPPARKGPWRLAAVPQLTAVEMFRHWSPVAEALGQAGFPCELAIHPSIAKFESEFLQGLADLVFVNPYHMVMARRAHGYVPLLRDRRPLEGVLLVRKDATVTSVNQLQGQRISFPAPNALAASLYIRAMLERDHRVRYEAHFALNHRNAIRQVLAGDSVAAGVVRTTFEMEPPEVREALHVLYVTPALAPHPLAVHPRVPVALRQSIVRTLLGLAQDPASQSLMAAIQMPNPMVADYARDYEPLNRLGIEKYVVTG